MRSSHSQDNIVIYIARGPNTYLAWQGSVLYEDGARISEVGIKDGCSVHLAIYSTDQVCMKRSEEAHDMLSYIPQTYTASV